MTLADSVLVDKGMQREEREGKLASIDQNRMMSTMMKMMMNTMIKNMTFSRQTQ